VKNIVKKIFFLFIFTIISLFFVVAKINAADTLVFDSTDKYLGACQLTNKSEWELKEDINVTKFQVWYNWDQGEASLPVKVFFNGEKFAEFEAKRADCDPYQHQWCNADYKIDKLFSKGKYTTEIPTEKQCLKPGGTGAIRLYADDGKEKKVEPTTVLTKALTQNQVVPTVITEQRSSGCSCSQTTIIVTAAITSVVSSALVALLLRR
jgi:hypothetical protein